MIFIRFRAENVKLELCMQKKFERQKRHELLEKVKTEIDSL